jgi:hypothetical protein
MSIRSSLEPVFNCYMYLNKSYLSITKFHITSLSFILIGLIWTISCPLMKQTLSFPAFISTLNEDIQLKFDLQLCLG